MENYEQKYKEALKVIEGLYNVVKYQSSSDALLTCQTIEKAFPELRESEDEKIRKAILLFFQTQDDNTTYSFIPKKDIISWLEKQGELVEYYEDKLDRCACYNFDKGYKAALEKQGESNPYSGVSFEYNGHTWGMCAREGGVDILCDSQLIKYIEKQGEKPWSEEDEYQINTILHGLDLKRVLYKKEGNKVEAERYSTQYNWLKSLKDRVQPQPKQEWSDEDERILNGLISSLARIGASTRTDSTSINYAFSKEIDWLKSLKPQPRWKPTEEQMEALRIAYEVGTANESWAMGKLKTLYNDLKNFKL